MTSWAGLTVFMFEIYSSQIIFSLRQMSIDRDSLSRVWLSWQMSIDRDSRAWLSWQMSIDRDNFSRVWLSCLDPMIFQIPKTLTLFSFPIVWLSAYPIKSIHETRRTHLIRNLCLYYNYHPVNLFSIFVRISINCKMYDLNCMYTDVNI